MSVMLGIFKLLRKITLLLFLFCEFNAYYRYKPSHIEREIERERESLRAKKFEYMRNKYLTRYNRRGGASQANRHFEDRCKLGLIVIDEGAACSSAFRSGCERAQACDETAIYRLYKPQK